MQRIARQTAIVYGVSLRRMQSEERTHAVAEARQIAFYVIWRRTGSSLPEIGRFFNRDHTTVLHGVKKISDLVATRREIAAIVDALMEDMTLAAPLLDLKDFDRRERERMARKIEGLINELTRTLQDLRKETANETP